MKWRKSQVGIALDLIHIEAKKYNSYFNSQNIIIYIYIMMPLWVEIEITCTIVRWKQSTNHRPIIHYDDVIMGAIASQITSLTIVYASVYSGADQSKHQSSASLAFVWGIHRGPVNSPHKWPVTRKMFPFDDVIMFTGYATWPKIMTWPSTKIPATSCHKSAYMCQWTGLAFAEISTFSVSSLYLNWSLVRPDKVLFNRNC